MFFRKDNPLDKRVVNINGEHGIINGTFYSGNEGSKEQPLIIFSHGIGDSQASGIDYVEFLAKNGYSSYAFNFNHGTYADDMTKMSIFTEEDDLDNVVDYFKDHGFKNIFLLGASQGGVVSAMEAANREKIKGIILLYPAFVLRDEMLELFPNNNFPETFDLWGMTLGREYLAKLPNYHILEEVSRYHGPVLIIHGTSDTVAPISYSRKVIGMYPNAKLIEIKRAGHGYYGLTKKKAEEYILKFVNEHK